MPRIDDNGPLAHGGLGDPRVGENAPDLGRSSLRDSQAWRGGLHFYRAWRRRREDRLGDAGAEGSRDDAEIRGRGERRGCRGGRELVVDGSWRRILGCTAGERQQRQGEQEPAAEEIAGTPRASPWSSLRPSDCHTESLGERLGACFGEVDLSRAIHAHSPSPSWVLEPPDGPCPTAGHPATEH